MRKGLKYIINGKFLCRKVTGVQRYACEITAALDGIVDKDMKDAISVLVPEYCADVPEYRNLKVARFGRLKPNLWEQTQLPFYLRKSGAVGINLCNVAPLVKPDIVCTHDVNFRVNPHFFTKKYRAWQEIQHWNFTKRAPLLITVSDFSKNEICREYGVDAERIAVIPSAWRHFEKVAADYGVFDRGGIEKGGYYFMLGSLAPNKNFRWLVENAKRHPDEKYVVAGNVNGTVHGRVDDIHDTKNILYLGYVTDGQAKALMKECRAFVFPSIYEGFGIPPLEALSTGAKVVCARTSSIPEVCGDAVYYIEPDDYDCRLGELIRGECAPPESVLDKYGWDKSARMLLERLRVLQLHG